MMTKKVITIINIINWYSSVISAKFKNEDEVLCSYFSDKSHEYPDLLTYLFTRT